MVFRSREGAGRQLADVLKGYRNSGVVALVLPRGGVPVGYQIARGLGVPQDLTVARKLGAPGHTELGIGAIASGGVRVLGGRAIQALNIADEYIERVTPAAQAEMRRRLLRFRDDRQMPDLRDRIGILVDDGRATSVTARAAIESIR